LKYSIIIPTYDYCNELLIPCVESIIHHTTLENIELIISANGCKDNTELFLQDLKTFFTERNLPNNFKNVWFNEAIGYPKAINEAIKISTGDKVILLNNDCVLLDQVKDYWIKMLEQPFLENEKVGITGPLLLMDKHLKKDLLFFFCVMIDRKVIDKIGLLDEVFSPGNCEDIDYCLRALNSGFELKQAGNWENTKTGYNGSVPIFHKSSQTFLTKVPSYKDILNRNKIIIYDRHLKNAKLNLGSGPLPYDGYLNIDLYDERADLKMDITKLDFSDNYADEILASHVFEHISPFKIMKTLVEWKRVLKPNGKLIMEMPNIEELCRQFINTNDKMMRYRLLTSIYGTVNTRHSGDPEEITSPHLFGWYPEIVYDHLVGAGFRDIKFMQEQIPGHDGPNFRVEAIK
jgi:GT2 family glycosyltransferase